MRKALLCSLRTRQNQIPHLRKEFLAAIIKLEEQEGYLICIKDINLVLPSTKCATFLFFFSFSVLTWQLLWCLRHSILMSWDQWWMALFFFHCRKVTYFLHDHDSTMSHDYTESEVELKSVFINLTDWDMNHNTIIACLSGRWFAELVYFRLLSYTIHL